MLVPLSPLTRAVSACLHACSQRDEVTFLKATAEWQEIGSYILQSFHFADMTEYFILEQRQTVVTFSQYH